MPFKNSDVAKQYWKDYALKHFKEIKIRRHNYYLAHKEQFKGYAKKGKKKREQHNKNDHMKRRMKIIELLGGKCANPYNLLPHPDWCNDPRCLQIDHINSGGGKERRQFSYLEKYYKYVLEQIESGSKGYQLLCANCNWIKRHEKKENSQNYTKITSFLLSLS
jgi:hypothetical protein